MTSPSDQTPPSGCGARSRDILNVDSSAGLKDCLTKLKERNLKSSSNKE